MIVQGVIKTVTIIFVTSANWLRTLKLWEFLYREKLFREFPKKIISTRSVGYASQLPADSTPALTVPDSRPSVCAILVFLV